MSTVSSTEWCPVHAAVERSTLKCQRPSPRRRLPPINHRSTGCEGEPVPPRVRFLDMRQPIWRRVLVHGNNVIILDDVHESSRGLSEGPLSSRDLIGAIEVL